MTSTATDISSSRSGGLRSWLERYPFLPALVILIVLLALNEIGRAHV